MSSLALSQSRHRSRLAKMDKGNTFSFGFKRGSTFYALDFELRNSKLERVCNERAYELEGAHLKDSSDAEGEVPSCLRLKKPTSVIDGSSWA